MVKMAMGNMQDIISSDRRLRMESKKAFSLSVKKLQVAVTAPQRLKLRQLVHMTNIVKAVVRNKKTITPNINQQGTTLLVRKQNHNVHKRKPDPTTTTNQDDHPDPLSPPTDSQKRTKGHASFIQDLYPEPTTSPPTDDWRMDVWRRYKHNKRMSCKTTKRGECHVKRKKADSTTPDPPQDDRVGRRGCGLQYRISIGPPAKCSPDQPTQCSDCYSLKWS
ncbi:hypothetical protein Pmani_031340 [Petrolisthes manimaculis]|uniref:Uncharacterized protein n=1 Tax=Petrolisthes manimaculis TaxID=1843537 RepID=A0AAE1NVX0_9EUCA|nr:hypothetical protein Pmani_031340 [Petrolisthes manimaculis]